MAKKSPTKGLIGPVFCIVIGAVLAVLISAYGKTPILQPEAGECGLACLAMVANAHGLYLDLTGLATESRADVGGRCIARAPQGVGMGAGAGVGGEATIKDSASQPAGSLTAGV